MSEVLKRKSLGRGLDALLGVEETNGKPSILSQTGIFMLPLDTIAANPFQPRSRFEEQSLAELAVSIGNHGVIQPVTVRRLSKDSYQLISGERRLKAAAIAGLKEIPAFLRIADDESMLEMSLIENTHREDLDPIEIAIGYSRLMDECRMTQEQLSDRTGKDRSTIVNFIRLLKLPPVIQLALRERKITMGHARALININNPAAQLNLFDKILDDSMSVRETENSAKKFKENSHTSKNSALKWKQPADDLLCNSLFNALSVKINIARSSGCKGKITIPFTSDEEFQKIADFLRKEQQY